MSEKLDVVAFNQMINAVTNVSTAVATIAGKVSSIENEMSGMRMDIDYLKDNTEITHAQKNMIRNTVKRRVYSLLKIPTNKKDRTEIDNIVAEKYRPIFFSRCYTEVANLGHLNTPYDTTVKKNYNDAISDIEAWIPRNGVEGLKLEADELARIKRLANAETN